MEPVERPGILPDDALAEAARKFLYYHFAAMLCHEAGAQRGEDVEELHDMRVAVRRMRAAFRVAAGAFDPKAVKPYVRGLRAVGRALGRVRDLDVFMQNAEEYLAEQAGADHHGLDPLIESWREEREAARAKMLAFLIGKGYQTFKRSFQDFLRTPGPSVSLLPFPDGGPFAVGEGAGAGGRVRDTAPVLIYQRLAAVRAYGPALAEASLVQLHSLRIECKRLRYTVELFRDALGEEAGAVVAELKKLQDHLGSLNDANVACQILGEFLEREEQKQMRRGSARRKSTAPVAVYLAQKHAERERLLVSFPEAWCSFEQPEFRRNLALAVSVL